MGKSLIILFAFLGLTLLFWLGLRSHYSRPDHVLAGESGAKDSVLITTSPFSEREAGIAAEEAIETAEVRALEKPKILLAEFLMTGDRAFLERARQRFPDDRLILLQSVLLANSPDSSELALLEDIDPENSLPNLIRASLFAESGDLSRFREELEKAMSKGKLDAGYRQRQALILDHIIADNLRDLDPAVYLGLDKGVVDGFGHAAKALANHPTLFGDNYESAGYAVALAEKLRKMGGGRQSFNLAAGQLEIDVLSRLDPRDEYVVEGKTIGQRIAELERQVPAIRQRIVQYLDPLMSPEGDPVLRLQFFARVRSVGEAEALGWLATKMDGQ